MASTILFVVMSIIAGLLLLVASITASMGAANIFKSTAYSNNDKARSAYQYLLIAAVLGWSSLVVLIIILIVAVVAGGFSTTQISSELLNSSDPSKADLIEAYRAQQSLNAGKLTQIIVIVIFIILALITLAVGLLAMFAAIQISGIPDRDDKARNAYTQAIITAIAAVGGIGVMVVAIVSYFGIRTAKQKQLRDAEAYVALTEQKLGVSRVELEAATATLIK